MPSRRSGLIGDSWAFPRFSALGLLWLRRHETDQKNRYVKESAPIISDRQLLDSWYDWLRRVWAQYFEPRSNCWINFGILTLCDFHYPRPVISGICKRNDKSAGSSWYKLLFLRFIRIIDQDFTTARPWSAWAYIEFVVFFRTAYHPFSFPRETRAKRFYLEAQIPIEVTCMNLRKAPSLTMVFLPEIQRRFACT